MTLTANQEKMLNEMMPEISKQVMNGVNALEAFYNAIRNRVEFCAEMAQNETARAKKANNSIFEEYLERK